MDRAGGSGSHRPSLQLLPRPANSAWQKASAGEAPATRQGVHSLCGTHRCMASCAAAGQAHHQGQVGAQAGAAAHAHRHQHGEDDQEELEPHGPAGGVGQWRGLLALPASGCLLQSINTVDRSSDVQLRVSMEHRQYGARAPAPHHQPRAVSDWDMPLTDEMPACEGGDGGAGQGRVGVQGAEARKAPLELAAAAPACTHHAPRSLLLCTCFPLAPPPVLTRPPRVMIQATAPSMAKMSDTMLAISP